MSHYSLEYYDQHRWTRKLWYTPVPTLCPAPFQALPVVTVAPGFAASGFAGAALDSPTLLMLQFSPPAVAQSLPLFLPALALDALAPLQARKHQPRGHKQNIFIQLLVFFIITVCIYSSVTVCNINVMFLFIRALIKMIWCSSNSLNKQISSGDNRFLKEHNRFLYVNFFFQKINQHLQK